MSSVLATLRRMLAEHGAPGDGYCVAFSGGLDSMVLLHALHSLRGGPHRFALRAVHIHHGLHPDADAWSARCEAVAAQLDVAYVAHRVTVERDSGEGLEAAARRARYAAFAELLRADEQLLTAHHEEDQLETYLLRLLRGAGVHGLASIVERAPFANGWLLRPLLIVGRVDLTAYAQAHGLNWIEDPSNTDTTLDRNYLRHNVIPLLRARWPGMAGTIGRAARLSAEAAELIDGLAAGDCARIVHAGLIDLRELRTLAPPRQRNVIRHVLRQRGLHPPSEMQLLTGLDQLLSAGDDRHPVLRWPGGQVRRYRQRLYVLEEDPSVATDDAPVEFAWDGSAPIDLGPVRGRVQLVSAETGGFCIDPANGPLTIRFRRGGERLREADHRHHILLKKLYQERGVVPWMRSHVPLLAQGDTLLAVGDFWSRAGAAADGHPAVRVVWDRHPIIQ